MSYNYLTQFNSPNYTSRAATAAVYGIARSEAGFTHHWWGNQNAGATFDGVVSWLSRPNGNTSAHYVVEAGRVACIVSPLDTAWHSGSARGNATTIGIEMNPRASKADYDTVAQLNAQLIDAFGDQLKYRHSDWTATQCPGVYDINRIDRESYLYNSGAEWGNVSSKSQPPTPPPTPPPTTPPPVVAEWIKNLVDITDVKLTVLPADGVRRFSFTTGQYVDGVIPKGTQIDIAKETTVGGKKYYISSYSASGNIAIGLPASSLGIPATPPPQEKPEWLKNLKDIADQDFWTRSETPVLKLADGTTSRTLPIDKKVRITHSTTVVGINLLVLDGGTEAIETVYLSDKPIKDKLKDIDTRLTALEALVKKVVDFLSSIFSGFKK